MRRRGRGNPRSSPGGDQLRLPKKPLPRHPPRSLKPPKRPALAKSARTLRPPRARRLRRPRPPTPGAAAIGAWRLRVADDRVGALAESGKIGANNEFWIELGLDGHLIGKWTLGRDLLGGFAFTNDARLCRQTPGKAMPGIECLDRGTSVWEDAGDAPARGVLLGAQGDELVFSRDEGVLRLYWVKVP
jgi:hypothetical protein